VKYLLLLLILLWALIGLSGCERPLLDPNLRPYVLTDSMTTIFTKAVAPNHRICIPNEMYPRFPGCITVGELRDIIRNRAAAN
jgi:hypothetical protein